MQKKKKLFLTAASRKAHFAHPCSVVSDLRCWHPWLFYRIANLFTLSEISISHNQSCVSLWVLALWSVYNLMHSPYSLVIFLPMENYPTTVLSLLQAIFQHLADTFFQFRLLPPCVLKSIFVVLTNIHRRHQMHVHSLEPLVITVKLTLAWSFALVILHSLSTVSIHFSWNCE